MLFTHAAMLGLFGVILVLFVALHVLLRGGWKVAIAPLLALGSVAVIPFTFRFFSRSDFSGVERVNSAKSETLMPRRPGEVGL